MLKRVAAMHDISGIGHCSLSAAMAILPAMGIQCCPVPTCVLSTQTDGYDDFTFFDLTDQLGAYITHWKKLGERFDAVFTGYLGSTAQLDIALQLISELKAENGIALVDPVMGDDGVQYSSMPEDICCEMRKLIGHADIITPNLTEACLLTSRKFGDLSDSELEEICAELSMFGPKMVVISGIFKNDSVLMACYDHGKFYIIDKKRITCSYPGSGDVFSSVLVGKLLSGYSLLDSVNKAADFVGVCISESAKMSAVRREGIVFEPYLRELFENIQTHN